MGYRYVWLEADQALAEMHDAAKAGLDGIGTAWVDPTSGLPDPVPPGLQHAAALFARTIAAAEEARAAIAADVAEEQRRHDEEWGTGPVGA